MTIKKMLQSDNWNIRIEYADRWLYWDNTSKLWVVRERKRHQKHSRVVTETESEEDAVDMLLKG